MKRKPTSLIRPPRWTPALLVPLALAACSLEPTYQRPESPVPQAYPTGPAYESANTGPTG